MKKLFSALLLGAFTLGFSQSDYYNDYRSSVTGINWQTVAAELLLTQSQKDQLFALNNRYDDYNSWNSVYGNNPERWRTDRYSEMERIMGSANYTKFKNKYYKGQNPVAVYNRNKNNYKAAQNKKYAVIKNKKVKNYSGVNSTKAKEYERRKNSGDGSHLYIKGSNGKGHGNGNGKGKGHH